MDAQPAIQGILETVLYGENLEEMEQFYSAVLGLTQVQKEPDQYVFFRCGAGMLLLFDPRVTRLQAAADSDNPIPAHGATGPGHIAFRVSAEELAAWRDRLKTLGVDIEYSAHWTNGAESIYFRDPAGNSVELATARLWGLENPGPAMAP